MINGISHFYSIIWIILYSLSVFLLLCWCEGVIIIWLIITLMKVLSKKSERSSHSSVQWWSSLLWLPVTLQNSWVWCLSAICAARTHFVHLYQPVLSFMHISLATLYMCVSVCLIITNIHSYLHAFVFDILYSWHMTFFHYLLLMYQDPAEMLPLP